MTDTLIPAGGSYSHLYYPGSHHLELSAPPRDPAPTVPIYLPSTLQPYTLTLPLQPQLSYKIVIQT